LKTSVVKGRATRSRGVGAIAILWPTRLEVRRFDSDPAKSYSPR
jgi:hypothetical protein